MPQMDTAIEQLLENDYAQEQLRVGLKNLRAAYARASKRRVEPTRDERIRRQLRTAAGSITESAKAFRSGRQKPKPRWGRRLLLLGALAVVGTGVALVLRQQSGGDSESDGMNP